ncbi:MAG: DUF3298 domain-containing protein [Bacteroidota bacterium]
MKKIIAVLLLAASIMACQNKNQKTTGSELAIKSDTLSFNYDSLKVYSKNIPDRPDTTYAKISYPIFKNDTLNQYLKRQVFDFFAKEEPATSYQDIANSFVKGYDDFVKDDRNSRPQTWCLIIKIEVLRQKPNYLALRHTHYDYTGGAHGNTNISYINYNPQQHKEITLDSLIGQDKMPALTSLAEGIFRKDEKLSATEPLEGKYFFDDGKFILAQNFYVSDQGLVFLYNAYEIKPYSEGTTALTIPFAALKDLAKPHTILTSNP